MAYRKIEEIVCGAADTVVKVHYDASIKEYRARVYIGGKAQEESDAFDSDKESIMGTARHMADSYAGTVVQVEEQGTAVTPPAPSAPLVAKTQQARKPRPRGYYAQPSKLFGALMNRV